MENQMGIVGVVGVLVLLIVIGYVSITGLTLNADYSKDVLDGMPSSDTSNPGVVNTRAQISNVTSKVTKSYGQASNLPYIYVAVLMIAAILSILGYLKYYGG